MFVVLVEVTIFDVAKPDPKDAIDAVRRACGAPADAVAVKAHMTKGALALMRIEPGHVRMRKSHKPPRNIHELTRRIERSDQGEKVGHPQTQQSRSEV